MKKFKEALEDNEIIKFLFDTIKKLIGACTALITFLLGMCAFVFILASELFNYLNNYLAFGEYRKKLFMFKVIDKFLRKIFKFW